jgi:hypothetical protein
MTAPSDDGVDSAERVEHRWAALSVAIMVLLVAMATFAAVYHAAMPQARVETVDPRTLHLGGEFIESNLGSTLEPDGSVTLRGIGQQYSFTPSCMVLPTNTLITLRATSADVVHGFLIDGTNINCLRKSCLNNDDYIVVSCQSSIELKQVHAAILKSAGYEIAESSTKSSDGSFKLSAKFTVSR